MEKLFFSWLIKGWANAYIKSHRNSRLVDVPVMTAKGKKCNQGNININYKKKNVTCMSGSQPQYILESPGKL